MFFGRPDRTACLILGGKEVMKGECQEQCRVIPRNVAICKGKNCPSPWRLCMICVSHGYVGDSAVVKVGKVFCTLHTLDAEAQREREIPRALPPMREQRKQKKSLSEYIQTLRQNTPQWKKK